MAKPSKRLLKDLAADLDIDALGISNATDLSEASDRIWKLKQIDPKLASALKGFRSPRYFLPYRHLNSTRSIISACQCHLSGEDETNDPTKGVIASYTRSNHYEDLRRKLLKLADFLRKEYGARTKVFSCYVSLAEKPLAEKAGIGSYGKNGIIFTPTFGSLVVLGEILTDAEFEPDTPLEWDCGVCRVCIDTCPTGAIVRPYVVDRTKCLQYLSERSCTIPLEVREVWGNRLYGCTTCQDVCPRNSRIRHVTRKVEIGNVGATIPLEEVIVMDEEKFAARFANNQIGMRECNAIRKNAIIAAGNSRSDTLLPPLLETLNDPDPIIRRHTYWAVAKINPARAKSLLEKALVKENDASVQLELKTILDGLSSLG